jgi:hypothetical protein
MSAITTPLFFSLSHSGQAIVRGKRTFCIHPLRIQVGQHGLVALLLEALRRFLIHQTTTSPSPPLVLVLEIARAHLPLRRPHAGRQLRLLSDGRGGGGRTGLDTFGEGKPSPLEECGRQFGGVAPSTLRARPGLLSFGAQNGCTERIEVNDGQVGGGGMCSSLVERLGDLVLWGGFDGLRVRRPFPLFGALRQKVGPIRWLGIGQLNLMRVSVSCRWSPNV